MWPVGIPRDYDDLLALSAIADNDFQLLTKCILTFLQKVATGCILLKDKPAEKASTRFGGRVKRVTPVNALKGDLLIAIPDDKLKPRSHRKRPSKYRLVKDETITVHAEIDDIAPLTDRDFQLLLAIETPLARYEVFSSNEMKWGLGLKPGDAAYVTIQGNVRVRAIIRYIGELAKLPGRLFGVEIMVRT